MKKKILVTISIATTVLLSLAACGNSEEFEQAVADFDTVAESVNLKNTELDEAISNAEAALVTEEEVYDANTLAELTTAIAAGKDARREIPEIPEKLEDIQAEIEKLSEPLDYTSIIADITTKQTAVEDSIQQLKQITNPSEDFVIQCLQGIEVVSGTQAVTEDHDPNGNLNKQGGYTAAVYFSSTWIDQSQVYGNDIVDKGTDAGGCIEVYSTVEDATKRNDYLSAFDGAGAFNSGSHIILGTIVIRTSPDLTATQQNDLTQIITNQFLTIR